MDSGARLGRAGGTLYTAMKGEAFANAKYTLYANKARATGQPRLDKLFTNAAGVELKEHFAEEATLAGLVCDNAANLRRAMVGEGYEATTMYPAFARIAAGVDDKKAAELFREIARDDAGHLRTFADALRSLLR